MPSDSDKPIKDSVQEASGRKAMGLSLVPSYDPATPLTYKPTGVQVVSKAFDDDQKKVFLSSLSEFPSTAMAARAAGVSMTTAYKHKYKDADFSEAWDIAIEIGYNILEAEAIRRAVMGVKEDVYHKGEVVGQVTKYSDTLLAFLLKGRRRDVFGDKANENSEDASITIRVVGGLPDA